MAQEQHRIPVDYREDEEILIGPFFKNLKGMFMYILKRWWIMLIGIAIFVGLALGYAWWYGTKYIATATFSVEGQSPSSGLLSSAMSLANSLGMQTTQGKGSVYNNNFFANLIQSRRVIKESLMKEGTMNGKKDLMANHYINLYHWRTGGLTHKGWNKIPKLKNFAFTSKPLNQFNSLEDSIINIIYDDIIDNNLEVTFDETLPFNTATFNTRNRDYSLQMMKYMLDKAAGYYMENVYSLNKKNLAVADARVDSLGRELKRMDYRVASLRDQTNNLIKQQGQVPANTAAREQNLLQAQYQASVNNVELAKVTLLTQAPILEVIDDPTFATEVSFVSKVIAIIVGVILGIFFTSIYLIISRAVKESNRKLAERQQRQEETNSGTAAA